MRDRDIRVVLRRELKDCFGSDPDTLILEEMGLCQGSARIDMAVVNGSINGYEIKSAQDTLERLHSQQKIYSRIFDTVTLIIAGNHLAALEGLVPSWWGILEAEEVNGNVKLREVRPSRENPSIDPSALVQLLWRDEALQVLEEKGLAKGLRSKPRRFLWQKITESLTIDEIRDAVSLTLKRREGWLADVSQM